MNQVECEKQITKTKRTEQNLDGQSSVLLSKKMKETKIKENPYDWFNNRLGQFVKFSTKVRKIVH